MQNFNPLTRRPVFNMDGVSRESRDYGMTADTVAGEAGPIDTSPASEFIARMRAERQNKPKPWQRRNPLIAKPIRYDEPKGGYQQPGAPNDLSKPVRFPVKGNENPTNPVIRPGAPPIVPRDFATQPANDLLSVGDRMQPVNDMDSGYLRTGISDRARQVRNPILAARRQFNRMD